MQLVTEMTLPLLAAEQPDFSADPMPFVEAARREHPWLARSNVGGYLVHGYQAVKDMVYLDDKLRPSADGMVEFYGADPNLPWSRFMTEMMLFQHGPTHTRMRASVADAFTPKNVNRYRMLMRDVVSKLLDAWVPKRSFDFPQFAANFPITVFCGILGLDPETIPGAVREAFEVQSASTTMDRDLLPKFLAAYDVMWDFADKIINDREKQGGLGDGLLDQIILAKNTGKLDETELRHMVLLLAIAGYDTSKNMLTLTMHEMLRKPDQWARCAEDLRYCGKVVEEIFRHSGVSSVYRFVTEDFEYDGVRFPKDTLLIFMMGLAGRDPNAFPAPMDFNPERVHTERHLAFGRGVHICIGQHLARAQMEEGIHVIAQRITKPRLVGEVQWRPYLGIWGIKSLPIAFEPAPARDSSSRAAE
jgi:cytochrome P450